MSDWKHWYTHCVAALARGDRSAARGVVERAISAETGEESFDPASAIDQLMRLRVAERDDLEWRASAEAFADKSTADLFHHGFMRECLLAIRFLAALLHFPDNERAAYNLKRSLELCPNFLFSLVELSIIERGLDRTAIFSKIAELPHRWDWRYKLAAAQLGFEIGSPLSNSTGAICLRGQVDENITSIVRLHQALNPGLKVFVATWDSSPTHILEDLRGTGAIVLTESDPTYAGGSNKNRQIKLARACLHAAAQSNAQFVLLGRTDFALFRLQLFAQLVKMLNQFPVAAGPLKQRIVVPDVYTRKFHLWHPSDLLMFGTTQDLIEYWSAPFTTADNPGLYPTEIYLAAQFCERHKLPLNSEFHAWREFLRDFFIIRDLDWFEACWLKRPHMRNGDQEYFIHACVSQRQWENLYYADSMEQFDTLADLSNGLVLESVLGLPKF